MAAIKQDKYGYYFIISAGFHLDGRRRQIKRTGFRTKREAQLEMDHIKSELIKDEYVNPSSTYLNDFIDEYFEMRKHNLEESTLSRYKRESNSHIKPYFQNIKIQNLNPSLIQKYFNYIIEEKGFSRSTCEISRRILSGVLNKAVERKLIKDTPLVGIELPKQDEYEFNVWNKEQINKFLKIGETTYAKYAKHYITILIALMTGLRKGEILALMWDNVDLDRKIIFVDKILDEDNQIQFRTKTATSKRSVTIPEILVKHLKEHKIKQDIELKKHNHKNENNLVICTLRGKPVYGCNLNRLLKNICEKYDLPYLRFHDLRHTHATTLIADDVHFKIVQKRLGHKKSKTTLDTYSHVLPEMQQIAADKLDHLFGD
ncbi:tyrosine-type recombinase/integrase [Neobacillus niacini]|uniref:site-specific integrase n=1 Tax=Neobacillus niacini TaxID=86668 RepID=UPI002FFDEA2F